MKYINKLVCALILVTAFGLTYSCKDKTSLATLPVAEKEVSDATENESGGALMIAKINVSGEYDLTVSNDSLAKKFESFFEDEENHDYSHFEIVKSVPDDDPADIAYLLLATSHDKKIKTAVLLSASSDNQSLILDMSGLKTTCISDCESGCIPTRMRNPETKLVELTCSACSNGGKCNKAVRLG